MNHDRYSDDYLAEILGTTRTIAVVGASSNAARPVYGVMRFLISRGYTVWPVNPGQAGKDILGQATFARLADISNDIDMIDVFRASDAIPALVDEILALERRPKVIWMQLGIRNDQAAAKAEAAGIKVVMNHCSAVDYSRLAGRIQAIN
jgi:predicted CoA-binding protein